MTMLTIHVPEVVSARHYTLDLPPTLVRTILVRSWRYHSRHWEIKSWRATGIELKLLAPPRQDVGLQKFCDRPFAIGCGYAIANPIGQIVAMTLERAKSGICTPK